VFYMCLCFTCVLHPESLSSLTCVLANPTANCSGNKKHQTMQQFIYYQYFPFYAFFNHLLFFRFFFLVRLRGHVRLRAIDELLELQDLGSNLDVLLQVILCLLQKQRWFGLILFDIKSDRCARAASTT